MCYCFLPARRLLSAVAAPAIAPHDGGRCRRIRELKIYDSHGCAAEQQTQCENAMN